MFRLLSKETNIFSIPVYIGFLLLIVIVFNVFNINVLNMVSAVVTFAGIAIGYTLFNKIALTRRSHLPLFLYTVFIFSLYPGSVDIGIAVALLSNSILLIMLTSNHDKLSKNSYILVGSLLAINYLFLPTTWPLVLFVLFHIIGTSDRIGLNIFRLFFGIGIIFMGYFSLMYYLGYTHFDESYLPTTSNEWMMEYGPLASLFPIAVLTLYTIADHFIYFNRKSPSSKFKYTFLLTFLLAQIVSIFLYMGESYEYLLLITLPLTIILSRYLRFLRKYWKQEIGLWLITICLLLFKLNSYFHIF
ncbi:MAG: hypothetical protein KBA33_08885 [Cloacibacterium sp.]|nr:hypothetical protein [Cloacibacterium sp.]